MTGLFITLEGPDGCGKSTQIAPLADYLRSIGRTVFTTREPGGTAISDQVRQILMAMKNTSMHPRTELLLFLSARAQLVEEVIRPRLAAGEIVISDRYGDSTLAYQGYGHGYDRDTIRRLLEFATGGLKPDLTLLIDVDVEEGLRRRQVGGGEWNRLDAYQLEFHRRVREGYHELAKLEPARWVTINGEQTPEMVQLSIRQAVDERIV
ncbi:dTMP kinase [Leptolinea tardivitalis]|uniref:Thymidylate kinase n=1 Tax=Leptolinea tardivitalis TaxID=229920 RepID=A0A0P6XI12_9CHLR|nr:dTMP kinase [Leptolinea tardivitalis]KPL75124.1 thymidylate kinase [Leptolinea tardivitalis]GAP20396.1 thymidylate kinase [Leptolinea tardivitalis]